MTEEPELAQLRAAAARYQAARQEFERAKRSFQDAVGGAARGGLSLRYLERAAGGVVSSVTIHNWLKEGLPGLSPGERLRRIRRDQGS